MQEEGGKSKGCRGEEKTKETFLICYKEKIEAEFAEFTGRRWDFPIVKP